MVKDDKKARARKRANNRKPSGVFSLDLRVVFKRAFFRLSKSKPVRVAILSGLSGIIILLVRYMLIEKREMPSLNNPQSYVPWRQHEKVLKERDRLAKENEAVKSERDEDNNVRDSLHEVWKELNNNWIIYISPSESNKKSVRINKHIQRILRACREFKGPIDGNPYETYKAVIDFQNNHRLEKKDAIIGPETWAALIDKLEEVKGEPGSLGSYAYPR